MRRPNSNAWPVIFAYWTDRIWISFNSVSINRFLTGQTTSRADTLSLWLVCRSRNCVTHGCTGRLPSRWARILILQPRVSFRTYQGTMYYSASKYTVTAGFCTISITTSGLIGGWRRNTQYQRRAGSLNRYPRISVIWRTVWPLAYAAHFFTVKITIELFRSIRFITRVIRRTSNCIKCTKCHSYVIYWPTTTCWIFGRILAQF